MDVIAFFDTVTGKRIGKLPAESWQWSAAVNGPGSGTIVVPMAQETAHMNLREITRPWRTLIAVIDGARVCHAGPVYQRTWDADTRKLTLNMCSFFDLLKLRLVLNPLIKDFKGGVVPTGEGVIPERWQTKLQGSLGDIARSLVKDATMWGRLPVVLPPVEGGQHVRTYLGPDLATVNARLGDLMAVVNGPEILFQPRLEEGGAQIVFHMLTGSPELVVATHSFDQRRSATPITGLQVTEDAAKQAGDGWAKAGAQEDEVLVARTHDTWLELNGWPLMQTADTAHSTVSSIETLSGYTDGLVQARARNPEAIAFKVRRTDEAGNLFGSGLTVGDHIRFRAADPYLGDTIYKLKVLELSGDAGDWVSVACREVNQ